MDTNTESINMVEVDGVQAHTETSTTQQATVGAVEVQGSQEAQAIERKKRKQRSFVWDHVTEFTNSNNEIKGKLSKATELQGKTNETVSQLQAELAEAKQREEILAATVQKLCEEVTQKEETASLLREEITVQKVSMEQELTMARQDLESAQRSLEEKQVLLDAVPSRIENWRNATAGAIIMGCMEYYGVKNFRLTEVGRYADLRIQALKEEDFTLEDSEDMDDGGDHEEMSDEPPA